MRRGLMGWNPEELPKSALEARITRLRAAMACDGLDAVLFYTNLVRPSAVTWLTGFTPYWSDGILSVGASGAPAFATALSKRVANWIRSTNSVSEIVNTPRPGVAVGKRLAEAGAKRAGVLELDSLPSGLYDEIVGAAPGIALTDASAVFAAVRSSVDDAERALIVRADALAVAALAQIDVTQAKDAGTVAGLVEKQARLGGAEEAYIAVAPDLSADRRMIRVSRALPLGDRFAVRASVAYKGSWVRRVQSFASDAAGAKAMARGDAWLASAVASIVPGVPVADQLGNRIKELPGATLRAWTMEGCLGSNPLQAIAGSATHGKDVPAGGSFAVLTIELAIDGMAWLGAAPAFVGRC
ncbi:MAG: aminopeptidase P family N-terminal domain-containing protein [Xanthobacteraceae bacterium]